MPINFEWMRAQRVTAKETTPPGLNDFGRVGGFLNIWPGAQGFIDSGRHRLLRAGAAGAADSGHLAPVSLEGFHSDLLGVLTVSRMTEQRFNTQLPAEQQMIVNEFISTIRLLPPPGVGVDMPGLLAVLDAAPWNGAMYLHLALEDHAVGVNLIRHDNRLTILYSDLGGFNYDVDAQVDQPVMERLQGGAEGLGEEAGQALQELSQRARQLLQTATRGLLGSPAAAAQPNVAAVRDFGLVYSFDVGEAAAVQDAETLLNGMLDAARIAKVERLPRELDESLARRRDERLLQQQRRIQEALQAMPRNRRDSPLSIQFRKTIQRSGCCAYRNMNAALHLHLAKQYLRTHTATLGYAVEQVTAQYKAIRKRERLEALADLIRWTKAEPQTVGAGGGVPASLLANVINRIHRGGAKWVSRQELLLALYEVDPEAFQILSQMIRHSAPVQLVGCEINIGHISAAQLSIFSESFAAAVSIERRGTINVARLNDADYIRANIDNIESTVLRAVPFTDIYIGYEAHFRIPQSYGATHHTPLAVIRQAYEILHVTQARAISNLQLDIMVILRIRAYEIDRKAEASRTTAETAHLLQLNETIEALKENVYLPAALFGQIRPAYDNGSTGRFTVKIPMPLRTVLSCCYLPRTPRTKTLLANGFIINEQEEVLPEEHQATTRGNWLRLR